MKQVAIITEAFGNGLIDRIATYDACFKDYGLIARYCSREELIAKPDGVQGVIVGVEQANNEFFKACKDLRVAMKFGVGLDNFDIEAAHHLGINVANLPGINRDAVAELVITFILSLSRKVCESTASCAKGNFQKVCSNSIYGKTLGIIGAGAIGKKVAELVQPFQLKCIGYDIMPITSDIIQQVELNRLLEESDFITVHVPLSRNNYHLINASNLKHVKKSAILINTSRGGVVDDDALAESLRLDEIAGAGLDVYESEESASKLVETGRVICTPHVAAYTFETLRNMERIIIEKISTLLYEEK